MAPPGTSDVNAMETTHGHPSNIFIDPNRVLQALRADVSSLKGEVAQLEVTKEGLEKDLADAKNRLAQVSLGDLGASIARGVPFHTPSVAHTTEGNTRAAVFRSSVSTRTHLRITHALA